jgi:hypothetical protein
MAEQVHHGYRRITRYWRRTEQRFVKAKHATDCPIQASSPTTADIPVSISALFC